MNDLFEIDPTALVNARVQSHTACQWATKAARANLSLAADDSHSNFGWNQDLMALVSHELDSQGHAMAFSLKRGSLILLENGEMREELPLDGATEEESGRWTDAQLEAQGLQSTRHAAMPYELDPIEQYSFDQQEILALGQWFQLGFDVLSKILENFGHIAVAEPTVRCWPHHYDVGTLLLLDDEDPETARSIGVGLSLGDSSYAEPYFYCSPWPVPDTDRLGSAPDGLRWHLDGFVSLVATANSLESTTDPYSIIVSGVKRAEDVLR